MLGSEGWAASSSRTQAHCDLEQISEGCVCDQRCQFPVCGGACLEGKGFHHCWWRRVWLSTSPHNQPRSLPAPTSFCVLQWGVVPKETPILELWHSLQLDGYPVSNNTSLVFFKFWDCVLIRDWESQGTSSHRGFVLWSCALSNLTATWPLLLSDALQCSHHNYSKCSHHNKISKDDNRLHLLVRISTRLSWSWYLGDLAGHETLYTFERMAWPPENPSRRAKSQ